MGKKARELAAKLLILENELNAVCREMRILCELFQRRFPARPPRPGWMLMKVSRKTGTFEPSKLYWGQYYYREVKISKNDSRTKKKFFHANTKQDTFPTAFSKSKELRETYREFHSIKNELNKRRTKLLEAWEIVRKQLYGKTTAKNIERGRVLHDRINKLKQTVYQTPKEK